MSLLAAMTDVWLTGGDSNIFTQIPAAHGQLSAAPAWAGADLRRARAQCVLIALRGPSRRAVSWLKARRRPADAYVATPFSFSAI